MGRPPAAGAGQRLQPGPNDTAARNDIFNSLFLKAVIRFPPQQGRK